MSWKHLLALFIQVARFRETAEDHSQTTEQPLTTIEKINNAAFETEPAYWQHRIGVC